MQIDTLNLHGYIVAEAMSLFVSKYNRLVARNAGGPAWALEVIHGKGTPDARSVIRDTLRAFLKGQGKRINGFDAQLALRGAEYLLDNCGRLAYMHGEDIDRNAGKTVVVPVQRIYWSGR